MIRKIVLAIGISTIALTATACNTVQGLGRDVESVGKAGEEAID
ncbi:entericidin A/B family lipoprotein [Alteriqipengyuania sp. 357]